MDTVPKQKRSEIMSRVKSKDSKMEILFRKELWKTGLRYRKNSGKNFGKPDIVLSKHRTAIFIDSCFWHGCKRHCRLPATRKKYWIEKIERNKKRDKKVNYYYKKNAWKVFRIWEHDIKRNPKKIIKSISDILHEQS